MRFASLLIALLGTGCYGAGVDDGDEGSGGSTSRGGTTGSGGSFHAPGCGEERFSLLGTVNGQALEYSGDLNGHAWIQGGDPSTLDTPFAGGGSFHAEWPDVVADGQITTIIGWVALPPGGTRAGETLNFASGTMTKLDAAVTFELGSLSVDVVCVSEPCPDEVVEGAIAGCVEWTDL
jgi:hypothetical protein